MTSTKFKLGELIAQYSERCGNRNVKHSDISGVNRDKEFFPSKLVGENVSNYKVVPSGNFACNLMHVGRDVVLPIAYNNSKHDVFVSPAYTVFSIKEDAPLEPRYLEMWFKSNERDRYFWMHTDSSIRDGMTFDDMCDIEIDLPPIEIQKKYVDIYNAMIANQVCYERGLEDLKLTCEGYIEDLRRKMPSEKIGPYIQCINEKNSDGAIRLNKAASSDKRLVDSHAVLAGVNINGYSIVRSGDFAYNTVTTRNGDKISIALNTGEDCLVSPIYTVFRADTEKIIPRYLQLWFNRAEFDRYARFNSWGSAREMFTFDDMKDVEIPILDIKLQQAIADISENYYERKDLLEEIRGEIKNICPILIKGSLEEANK